MKSISAVLLLGMALLAIPARADFINGHSYVALRTWARANGFGGYTLEHGTEFVLTNKTSRLEFDQDSADSTVNGVEVRLSYPVAKGGFISQLDADKTIHPLVVAPKPSAKKITTICIDPGHGGKDTGYVVGHLLTHDEKIYTLALGLELRRQLQQAGFKVILTRDKDVYVNRSDRPGIANDAGADLFICLHFNSFPPDPASVHGLETYCITPVGAASSNDAEGEGADSGACPANRVEDKSLRLAYQVQRSLVRSLGMDDRDVRRARYEMLRTAEMPAILIEGGYMSNPTEGKKIFDAGWRKQMATALVKAVVNYQKLTAPLSPATPPATSKLAAKSKPGAQSP